MIRRFTQEDMPDIMRIWIEGNLDAHGFVGGDYWRRMYEHTRREIARSEVYVYVEKGEVAGFIGLSDSYVAGLFVDREHRSKGFGKALLNYAKKLKCTLSLHVFEENRGAVRFYLREGFSTSKREKNSDLWQQELLMKWKK